MTSLNEELMNFDYHEINLDLKDIFPKINVAEIKQEFYHLKDDNPHQTILNVAKELWTNGYDSILKKYGFWDEKYQKFSGHCHQCTPVLGIVLKSLGFQVSYLECFRIRDDFLETGKIEKVSPEEEPNPERKDEFCGIGRIPYCCLEVDIEGKKFYLTGKHIKPINGEIKALLTPVCYRDFTGVFPHQSDKNKSGIYLKTFNSDRIIWMKQTEKDPQPELFITYLKLNF